MLNFILYIRFLYIFWSINNNLLESTMFYPTCLFVFIGMPICAMNVSTYRPKKSTGIVVWYLKKQELLRCLV